MTAEQFCLWLQGYFDITENDTIPLRETRIIKQNLEAVMKKNKSVETSIGFRPDSTFPGNVGSGILTCSLPNERVR